MKEALKLIASNEEFVDKIFTLMLRMNLNVEIFKQCKMGKLLIKIKEKRLFEN